MVIPIGKNPPVKPFEILIKSGMIFAFRNAKNFPSSNPVNTSSAIKKNYAVISETHKLSLTIFIPPAPCTSGSRITATVGVLV